MTIIHIPEKDFEKLIDLMDKKFLKGEDVEDALERMTIIDPDLGLNYGIVSDKRTALKLFEDARYGEKAGKVKTAWREAERTQDYAGFIEKVLEMHGAWK